MKRRIVVSLLTWFVIAASVSFVIASEKMSEIDSVLDAFHTAAANADEAAYFELLAPEAVFLGTAPGERWTVEEFRAFVHPYFSEGRGWSYVPRERHVQLDPSGQVAWFDELLDNESYGETRGSGALRRVDGVWRIVQYNLTIPIPNELSQEVVALIRAADSPWEFSERLTKSWGAVFEITAPDITNAVVLAIGRSERQDYEAVLLAVATLVFDDEATQRLSGQYEQFSMVPLEWRVDNELLGVFEGWWRDGYLRLPVNASMFQTLNDGSVLNVGTGEEDKRVEASFNLEGFEAAFARVEVAVPAVDERLKPLLGGVDGVVNPSLIPSSKVDPIYPAKARDHRESGQVIIQSVIHANGTVGEASVIRVSRPNLGFEKAAVDAVKQWRYEPATVHGQPVDVYFTVVVDFSIHGPRR
jgi:TonB family protein